MPFGRRPRGKKLILTKVGQIRATRDFITQSTTSNPGGSSALTDAKRILENERKSLRRRFKKAFF